MNRYYSDSVALATKALDESNIALEKLVAIQVAATEWPRCCDLWQDQLGGMHCRDCAQKTFAMMRKIQKILGVNKDCRLSTPQSTKTDQ